MPDNVFFVAAINPYTGSAPGAEPTAAAPSADGTGDGGHAGHASADVVPTTHKGHYTVHQLPSHLNDIRWHFAPLQRDSLRQYVYGRMNRVTAEDNVLRAERERRRLADLIIAAHEFVAWALGLGSVSQRDIQRVFKLLPFLLKVLSLEASEAVYMAVALVYYLRLPLADAAEGATDRASRSRNALSAHLLPFCTDNVDFGARIERMIAALVAPPGARTTSTGLLGAAHGFDVGGTGGGFEREPNFILPDGVAVNQALSENIFAIVVATQTKVPVAVIGPPGCSKTLAVQTVVNNLKGRNSPTDFCKRFAPITPYYCQCSADTRPEDIKAVFESAKLGQRRLDEAGDDRRCVVFMDEASLPSQDRMVLKVLHSYLDECDVAFVAVSNAAFDAANANRMMQVLRSLPSSRDMRLLALSCLGMASLGRQDCEQFADGLCAGFADVLRDPELRLWFHYRDFVYMLRQLRRETSSPDDAFRPIRVLKALERNFNGVQPERFRQIVHLFFSNLTKATRRQFVDPPEDSYRSMRRLLKEALFVPGPGPGSNTAQGSGPGSGPSTGQGAGPGAGPGSGPGPAAAPTPASASPPADVPLSTLRDRPRYKLVIDPTGDESGVRLLFELELLNPATTEIVHLSVFPADNTTTYRVDQLSRIKNAMEYGKTLLLVRTGEIHGSLYDVFNQNFATTAGAAQGVFSKIAVGSRTKMCAVHPDFQCIVHLPESEFVRTPAPFLSRFEKYRLDLGECYTRRVAELTPYIQGIVRPVHKSLTLLAKSIGPEHIYGWNVRTSATSLILSHLPGSGPTAPLLVTDLTLPQASILTSSPQPPQTADRAAVEQRLLMRAVALRMFQLVPPEVAMVHVLPLIRPVEAVPVYAQLYLSNPIHFSLEALAQALVQAQLRPPVEGLRQQVLATRKVVAFTRASAASANLPDQINKNWPPELRPHVAVVKIDMADARQTLVEAELAARAQDLKTSVVIVALTNDRQQQQSRISFVRQLIDSVADAPNARTNLAWVLVVTFPPELLYKAPSFHSVFLGAWDFVFCDAFAATRSSLLVRTLNVHVRGLVAKLGVRPLELGPGDGPGSGSGAGAAADPILRGALHAYCVRANFATAGAGAGAAALPPWLNGTIAKFYTPSTRPDERVEILARALLSITSIKDMIVDVAEHNWKPENVEEHLLTCALAALNGEEFGSLSDMVARRLNDDVQESLAKTLGGICSDYGLNALVHRGQHAATEPNVLVASLRLLEVADAAALATASPSTFSTGVAGSAVGRIFLFTVMKGIFDRILSDLPGPPTVAALAEALEAHPQLKAVLAAVPAHSVYVYDYAMELTVPIARAYVPGPPGSAAVMAAAELGAAWLMAVPTDGAVGERQHGLSGRLRLLEMHVAIAHTSADLLMLLSAGRILGGAADAAAPHAPHPHPHPTQQAPLLRHITGWIEARRTQLLNGAIKRKEIAAYIVPIVQLTLLDRLETVARPLAAASPAQLAGVAGLAEWTADLAFFLGHMGSSVGVTRAVEALNDDRVRTLSELLSLAWLLVRMDPRVFAPVLTSNRLLDLVASARTYTRELDAGRRVPTVLHDEHGVALLGRVLTWILAPVTPAAAVASHPAKLDVAEWFLQRPTDQSLLSQSPNRDALLKVVMDCAASVPMPRLRGLLTATLDQHMTLRAAGLPAHVVSGERDSSENLLLGSIAVMVFPDGGPTGVLTADPSVVYIPPRFADSTNGGAAERARLPAPLRNPLVDAYFWHAVDAWDAMYLAATGVDGAITVSDAASAGRALARVWRRYHTLQLSGRSSLRERIRKGILRYIVLQRLAHLFVLLTDDAANEAQPDALAVSLATLPDDVVEVVRQVRVHVLVTETSATTIHWVATVTVSKSIEQLATLLARPDVERLFVGPDGGAGWAARLSAALSPPNAADVSGRLSFTTSAEPPARAAADQLLPVMFAELYKPYADLLRQLRLATQQQPPADAELDATVALVQALLTGGAGGRERLPPASVQMLLILSIYYEFFGTEARLATVRPVMTAVIDRVPDLLLRGPPLRVVRGLLQPARSLASLARDNNNVSKLFALDTPLPAIDRSTRDFLVNLMATVVGTGDPEHHMWTLLFSPAAIHETYPFSSSFVRPVNSAVHYDCGCVIEVDGTIRNQCAPVLKPPGAYLAYMHCWGALELSMLLPPTDAEASPALAADVPVLYGDILTPRYVDGTEGATQRSKMIHFCHERVASGWTWLGGEQQHVLPLLLARSLERYAWLARRGPQRLRLLRATYPDVDDVRSAEDAFDREVYLHTWNLSAVYQREELAAQSTTPLQMAVAHQREHLWNQPVTLATLTPALAAYRGRAPADTVNVAILDRFNAVCARHQIVSEIPAILRLYDWIHTELAGRVTVEDAMQSINVVLARVLGVGGVGGRRAGAAGGAGAAGPGGRPEDPRTLVANGVAAFNRVHAATNGALRLGACQERQDFMRIDPDVTSLALLLSMTDKTENDVLMVVLRVLTDMANDFLESCALLARSPPTAPALHPVTLALLRAADRAPVVSVREASLPQSSALLMTLDAGVAGDSRLVRLLRQHRIPTPPTATPQFDMAALQNAVIATYVLGRCRLTAEGARVVFRFRSTKEPVPRPAGDAAAGGNGARRTAIAGMRHGAAGANRAEAQLLAAVGRLHIDQLNAALSDLRAGRERLERMDADAVRAHLPMALPEFLEAVCQRSSVHEWMEEDAATRFKDVKTEFLDVVDDLVRARIASWTELSSVLSQEDHAAMPPDVQAGVRSVLAQWSQARGLPDTFAAVSELLAYLSANSATFNDLAASADADHGIVAGLTMLGEEDLPALLTAMPPSLLDSHVADFQRLLLAWWADARRAQNAARGGADGSASAAAGRAEIQHEHWFED